MYHSTGLITVRTGSSRLPGKCLLKIQNKKIIECVLERALSAAIEPIICTTKLKEDDILQEIANEYSIKCFRGSVENKIKRWADCSEKFKLNQFHTIDADDPFFDTELVKKSMELLICKNLDFVKPSNYSCNGAGSVGYSFSSRFIKSLDFSSDDSLDTEMIEPFIKSKKNVHSKQIDEVQLLDYQIRLTLDYEEDFWMISTLSQILGLNPSREKIVNLLKKNPNLHLINFFRNSDWSIRQKSQTNFNYKDDNDK